MRICPPCPSLQVALGRRVFLAFIEAPPGPHLLCHLKPTSPSETGSGKEHLPLFFRLFLKAGELLYGGFTMLKVSLISLFVLPLTATCLLAQTNTMTSGRPSAALTPEQCQQVWSQAVPSGDALPQANAAPFIVNFKQADGNQDGAISQAEFDAACAKGLVKFTQR